MTKKPADLGALIPVWLGDETKGKHPGSAVVDERTLIERSVSDAEHERALTKSLTLIRKVFGGALLDSDSKMLKEARLTNALRRCPSWLDSNRWEVIERVETWSEADYKKFKLAVDSTGSLSEALGIKGKSMESAAGAGRGLRSAEVAEIESALPDKSEHSPEAELERALDKAELLSDPTYAAF